MGKIDKELREQMEAQEPYQESSDESMNFDLQQGSQRLPSNITPEDYYQYKRFINLPESQAEHPSKVDKDVVFGNFGGNRPSWEELRFEVGTIDLFETEFVIERKIPRKNNDGSFVKDSDGKLVFDVERVFDPEFYGSLSFLKTEYKFGVVSSRALGGNDRAAFLDISSSNRISKEFSKKKDQKNQFFGTGGGM